MPLSSRFTMPGQVRAVATSDPSGPLTVTGYGPNPLATVITRVDLSGKVEWQRTYPGTGKPQSRLATDGTLWLAYPDRDGQLLEGVLPDGSTGPTARPECHANEEIGAFVLLDDGFVISWVSGSRVVRRERSRPTSVPEPRVARYTREGECLWSTPIALGAVSFPGVLEMGDRTGWEIRPRRPWVPEEIGIDHWEPLLVSADRIAASFTDTRGGIGRTFFLDLDSGATISVTAPAPTGRKAIAGPGQFLLGSQGYGAFTTGRFGRDGVETARWASHGAMLVDKNGGVCGPELENSLPSRSRFRRLAPDNSLVDGPPLTGYYSSYPAMDCEGTAVFWRDGKLLAVDTDLAGHELFAMDDSRAVIGRALLLSEGNVVVSLDNEVLVFRTPLGSLAEGPWPCGEANLKGNPLLS
ncbi:hypothetical protein G3I37_31095 [Streptomyces anulatus]|uniref:PQQ-binding-like beta-propeller repeat protein n=1 Tax=Streptomyces anulatus TaxID=1892 RepID=A0A7K3RBK1_STRAQ|nr:hypothetical protein [Streptomyces anulatus]NED29289.1 hypothetical protein [Streptomyces anulatus]